MRDDFGIFIVSHARAEEVLDNTLKVLQLGGTLGNGGLSLMMKTRSLICIKSYGASGC